MMKSAGYSNWPVLEITFWIAANSYWMISGFSVFHSIQLFNSYSGKHLALIPFLTGVAILAYYCLFQRREERKEKQTVTDVATRDANVKLCYNSALITLFFDKGSWFNTRHKEA
jgi:hypothetical protein